jgi:phage tail-like protein
LLLFLGGCFIQAAFFLPHKGGIPEEIHSASFVSLQFFAYLWKRKFKTYNMFSGIFRRVRNFFRKLIHCHMNYPLPAFHFQVEWGGTRLGFTEVSGLNIETDVIEYREGSSLEYHSQKMPGMQKFSNITLKRGIMKGDNDFFAWISTIQMNQVERRDITIKLLDEEHKPAVTWKVKNAWPVKYSGPVLNARSHDVAIETLELAHEGVTVEVAN